MKSDLCCQATSNPDGKSKAKTNPEDEGAQVDRGFISPGSLGCRRLSLLILTHIVSSTEFSWTQTSERGAGMPQNDSVHELMIDNMDAETNHGGFVAG